MKPTKPPEPKTGDHVKLRGRGPHGVLKYCGLGGWTKVEWDGERGPHFVHIDELELV